MKFIACITKSTPDYPIHETTYECPTGFRALCDNELIGPGSSVPGEVFVLAELLGERLRSARSARMRLTESG